MRSKVRPECFKKSPKGFQRCPNGAEEKIEYQGRQNGAPSVAMGYQSPFCTFSKPFPEKSQKESTVCAHSLKKPSTWVQKVPKPIAKSTKLTHKTHQELKTLCIIIRDVKMGAQVLQWRPRVPQGAKKTQHGPPKSQSFTKMCRKASRNKRAPTDTNNQPTK